MAGHTGALVWEQCSLRLALLLLLLHLVRLRPHSRRVVGRLQLLQLRLLLLQPQQCQAILCTSLASGSAWHPGTNPA
jgi:hypothetical protein